MLVCIVGVLCSNYYNKKEEVEKVYKEIVYEETNTIKSAIDKVYDSVVVVKVKSLNGNATGSGFIYKKDSNYEYIITNHHVIDSALSITVTNSYGKDYVATLLGSDMYSDIAVLRIEGADINSVAIIGDSTKACLGDSVFTVGSPLGSKYQGTITKGIISGKNRQVSVHVGSDTSVIDVIQIDAAINPGNSGGPLVNMNGEVIGVNSMKLVESEVEGMGFAIPIETAIENASFLENGENIVRPKLGIKVLDINDAISLYKYGIILDSSIKSGVVIISLEENTAAYNSGLKVGDVITSINDKKVTDSASLKYFLYKYNIDDLITIGYIRDGNKFDIEIKLSN